MPAARVALWVASIGAVGLLARAVLVGPVPLWLAVSAFGGYLVLMVAGVCIPRLEMFGDVAWRGEPGRSGVALTFDDGPHPETTRRILEHLGTRGVPATFFVIGEKAERHPEVVREIVEAGHTLGIHGYHHDRLYAFKPPRAVQEDIRRAQDAVERASGVRPILFRPPIGQVSPRVAAGAARAGVTLVGWSARGLDGVAGAEADAVVRRVERRLRDGAIVLLHDAAEREDHLPASIAALPRILDAVERRGLRAVPLDTLIGE